MKDSKTYQSKMSATLYKAMKADILKGVVAPRGILGTGWKRIPAVNKFEVKKSEVNLLLESVGIQRRLPRKAEYECNGNKAMNRYMFHVIRRFQKSLKAKNYKLCWNIILWNMRHSVSFRLSAFIRVYPDWWKSQSITEVIMILKKVELIIRTWDDNLIFKRVYIPKDETKWRPLGVPSKEWRVVMHMWANWLTMYFQEDVIKYNHAYTPGHGTVTAWKEVILKVLPAKYIYEFDLKSFFDNVKITDVTRCLEEKLVPPKVYHWFNNIHRMEPEFPKDLKMLEPILESRKKMYQIEEAKEDPNLAIWEELKNLTDAMGEEMVLDLARMDGFADLKEWALEQWKHLQEVPKTKEERIAFKVEEMRKLGGSEEEMNMVAEIAGLIADEEDALGISSAVAHKAMTKATNRGLPQGLNTSPILSILTLKEWHQELKSQGVNLTMYADDGILYSDKPFTVSHELINQEKSSWLKQDGTWLKDSFKYLGIRYWTTSKTITAETRKGSRLEFGIEQNKLFQLLEELQGKKGEFSNLQDNKLSRLAKSALLGTIMSRLYEGNWLILDYPEKGRQQNANSWLKLVGKTQTRGLKPNLRSSTPVGYLRALTESIMRTTTKTLKIKKYQWSND